MQQGDQYALPVQITNSSGTVLTPDNCYDVKIQVGDLEKSHIGLVKCGATGVSGVKLGYVFTLEGFWE